MQNLHQNELSCTSRFIGLAAATILLTASSTVDGNGWVMNRDQTKELETVHHDAMTPEQLARFLAHPNGHAGWYFIQSLADRGERAVPLLEKLVNDEHPLVKQGAMAALIEIRKREFEDGDESTDTPATRRLISQMKPLVDDPSLAASIVEFLKFAEIDCADSREIAIKLSQSTELHLRAAAVEMATRFIDDAGTQVKIGMYASLGPKNVAREWGRAHGLIGRYKDQPVARQAVPAIVRFQNEIANSMPLRGMFSDGPQVRAMEILAAQWDEALQEDPAAVKAVCRTYVRAPYSYPGWAKTREITNQLVRRLNKDAVPGIRAAIKEEEQWLSEMQQDKVTAVTFDLRSEESFERAADLIAYLDYLADALEAKRPITKEPMAPPVDPSSIKTYEDKVPDPNSLDLDNLLD